MDALAFRIAELFEVSGFAEVEYIVTEDGTPLVTDINPRICGTMRIVAMATDTQIFDPAALSMLSEPSVSRYAAEIPYSGPSVTAPTLIATSRLTCSGASPVDVFDILAQRGFAPAPESLPQVWRAD
jgi:biotin carboxylase